MELVSENKLFFGVLLLLIRMASRVIEYYKYVFVSVEGVERTEWKKRSKPQAGRLER